jgi:hypothetical protein
MTQVTIDKLSNIHEEIVKMLQGPIDEAFNEKDSSAKKEVQEKTFHHMTMKDRHMSMKDAAKMKDKDKTAHDLAILAHDFAAKHYSGLGGNDGSYFNQGLPQDYHQNRDFYDKLNKLVSSNADSKSKECGVNCD